MESERFKEERDALEPDVERMDEALSGMVVTLSRAPQLGEPTDNPSIWAKCTIAWNDVPLIIYYSFDERLVVLESVRKRRAEET